MTDTMTAGRDTAGAHLISGKDDVKGTRVYSPGG